MGYKLITNNYPTSVHVSKPGTYQKQAPTQDTLTSTLTGCTSEYTGKVDNVSTGNPDNQEPVTTTTQHQVEEEDAGVSGNYDQEEMGTAVSQEAAEMVINFEDQDISFPGIVMDPNQQIASTAKVRLCGVLYY